MDRKKEKDTEKKTGKTADERKKETQEEEFNPEIVTEETFSEKEGRLPDEEALSGPESESDRQAEAAKDKKEKSAPSGKKEEEKASAETESGKEELPELKEDDPEGVKKRINALTRKYREQERKSAELAKKLEESESERKKWQDYAIEQDKKRLGEAEKGKEKEEIGKEEPEKEDPEPVYDEEKYEDYDQFRNEHEAWAVRQVEKRLAKILDDKFREFQESSKREAAQASAAEELEAKLAEGRKKYKDFDEVVGRELELGQNKDAMMDAIYDSEMAADLAYHIASNPEEAKRISNLTSPYAVAREIGKIEAKLSSSESKSETSETGKSSVSGEEESEPETENSTETEKESSSAPEPIETLGGSETVKKSLNDMSVEEYIRHMNKKEAETKGALI